MSAASRIISLLPSATETVCKLGLGDRLVGVTHECDYPPAVTTLPKVTRTLIPTDVSGGEIDALVRDSMLERKALYSLDEERFAALEPDLVVTQALCEVCAVAEDEVTAAAARLPGRPRVVNLEPESLGEALDALDAVAKAAGVTERAVAARAELEMRVSAVTERAARASRRPRAALLEWLDPPFSCGHWSPELTRLAGGIEVLGEEGERSRRLTWTDVAHADPEVLIVACCGLDVAATRREMRSLGEEPAWNGLSAVRAGRVHLVDGSQYFSRPGPRLVDSLEMLAHILDPELHPLPSGLPAPTPWNPGEGST